LIHESTSGRRAARMYSSEDAMVHPRMAGRRPGVQRLRRAKPASHVRATARRWAVRSAARCGRLRPPDRGTIHPMNTARRLAALGAAFTFMACGPIDIDVTTGEGDPGEGSTSTTGLPATTSISGSESGLVDITTSTGDAAEGTSGSSGTDTGGGSTGSSSSGEPPPVCSFDPTIGVCACDGLPAAPSMCSCIRDEQETCVCDGFVAPDGFCPCIPEIVEVDDLTWRCLCGGDPVDPIMCGCVLGDGGCWCDDQDLPIDRFSCGWPCAPSGPDPCVCGNHAAPADWC
jgi:hypothetical protein